MQSEWGTTVRWSPRGRSAEIPESLLERRLDATMYDYVILGAGCAGLSTCLALLEAGVTGPISVIDARIDYRDDRTWCFWDVEPTPFTHLARASWDTWRVAESGSTGTVIHSETAYVSLAATDFYTYTLDAISRYPNVELRLGERVGDPVEDLSVDPGGHAMINTSQGPVRSRQLVDSRGFSPASEEIALARATATWVPQQFLGLHIRAARPVFAPDECTLMDFDVDQSQGLRFMYVLPTSDSEALIEDVYMSETLLAADGYRREIETYLVDFFGLNPDEYEVLGEERGYIPMTDHNFRSTVSSHITALGVAGGATRASTGYTFLGIQRSVAKYVHRMVHGSAPAAEPKCSLLDAIFLRFLADNPGRAPRVFGLLFGRVNTDSLVRFLTERSTFADHARLIIALPKLPFLATAARVFAQRLTRHRGR